MRNKSKLIKFTIIIGVLAAAGWFGYSSWMKAKYAAMMARNMTAEVTVITISKQPVQLTQDLPARISAYKISEVRPQVTGVLKAKKFTEGSFVKEGQQLYQIDPTIYKASYDNASANLKAIEAKRQRYKNLVEFDAISKQEFDDMEAAFVQAQADYKTAKANLNYAKVLAPISGYIGKSNITEGMLVTANQADVLTTITQLDPIYVDMAQPTNEALKLGKQKEIPVTLIIEDQNYENSGKLKFTEMFADESTDSVRLRALFANKEQKLLPGMFATARLHLTPFEAILVPQRAANRAPDGSLSVFVIDKNNTAKLRPIKAEQIYNDYWIVTEGLNEGEKIVLEGFQKIADGAKVNIANSTAQKTETNSEMTSTSATTKSTK